MAPKGVAGLLEGDDTVDFAELPVWLRGLLGVDNPVYPGSNFYTAVQEGVRQGWFTDEAWNSGAGQANFENEIRETDEWKASNGEMRKYVAMKNTDPGTYKLELDAAKEAVKKYAAENGYNVDGAIDTLAEQYLMDGWKFRPESMQAALAAYIDYDASKDSEYRFSGALGDDEAILRNLARVNGVALNESYFTGAVRAIQGNLGTLEDYEREIRELGASAFPMYRDRIMNGEDVMDLVSPYMRVLADTYELDYNQISLNDDFLKMGLQGTADGPMSLWDYQMKLREQPYWINNTKQGRDRVVNVGTEVLRKMGFIGQGGTY